MLRQLMEYQIKILILLVEQPPLMSLLQTEVREGEKGRDKDFSYVSKINVYIQLI